MVTPFDPAREIAADLDTPVSALLKLRPLEPVFLLESVTGGEQVGRYSFIGLGKRNELALSASALTVDGVERETGGDPLGALRAWLTAAGLPSGGTRRGPAGLVGWVGYEAAGWFERLPAAGPSPFGLPTAAFVVPRAVLAFDHVRSTLTLDPLVGGDEARALEREVTRALRSGPSAPPAPGASGEARPNRSRADYEAGVERAREHIRAGDAYQIVLSVRFDGETEADPLAVYRALRLLNPSPYLYWVRAGGADVVGSSPEALARLEGRRALLRPIAGTRPRGGSEEDDGALVEELLADPKENAEHVMLVDLARNDLGRVAAPGTVEVTGLRAIERYSHVMHLVSTVEGDLPADVDQFDLFRAAFPAGTVTGAPKIRAMEIVAEIEGEPRGPYAGSVGYFGAGGSMDQAIAIRTLVFHDGAYAYQAGAGIVAESDPAREHAEVLNKARVLERALELASEEL
ncbi:MAG TPA: anthranilate synthase component I family protein [Gemmatimonadota bacterium]|nr:anthranilate synthase component I family protein [Gemmatimonadota bacterium]